MIANQIRDLDIGAPHILVVDDDDRLRKLLRRYRNENGYRVTTAQSATEAESKMNGLTFDLLVLDVMMPGENGVELTRRLRDFIGTPILLLTAMGEGEDRILGLESVPSVGERIEAAEDDRQARQKAEEEKKRLESSGLRTGISLDTLYNEQGTSVVKELLLILKADVEGSAEAIKGAIESFKTSEV